MARRAALLAVLGAAAGCYSYTPVTIGDVRPRTEVRARLSGVAVDRLRTGSAAEARLLDDFSISGEVSAVSADSLVLAVPLPAFASELRSNVTMQEVPLARGEITGLESRRLDRPRTAIAVAAGIAASAMLYASLRRSVVGAGGSGPGNGPPENRSPVLVRVYW